MANLQVKKEILEIVDNQLKANDPPCTKAVYERLLEAGCSNREAKEKIGTVVLTEIYDILKQGKSFSEEKYEKSLKEMLQQSLDFEEDGSLNAEWDELVQKGYECIGKQKTEEGLGYWEEAWLKFQSVMEQQAEVLPLIELMEEMELGNAGKNEERIAFCRKVLEIFDWKAEDDSCFQCGVADSLFAMGKKEDACSYYEKWLTEDLRNSNGIAGFSWLLLENGEAERAYELVRKATWGISCNIDNLILFMRAKQLAEYVG